MSFRFPDQSCTGRFKKRRTKESFPPTTTFHHEGNSMNNSATAHSNYSAFPPFDGNQFADDDGDEDEEDREQEEHQRISDSEFGEQPKTRSSTSGQSVQIVPCEFRLLLRVAP